MQAVESALGSVSFLSRLRADEIGSIARRFERVSLPVGASLTLGGSAAEARLVVVVRGTLHLTVDDPMGVVRTRVRVGDRNGVASLLTGHPRTARLTAAQSAELAILDRAGLEGVLAAYPAVALPLSAELASELRAKNDQVRQILELKAAGLGHRELEIAIRNRRRLLVMQSNAVRRLPTRALFRRLVIEQGAEPPFWILIGFLAALGGARLVVWLILKYQLERHFFALVASEGKNPMHIHHFNYGLVLAGISGVLALLPRGRRNLRLLALVFGLGCGLVVDEFALFWNLNPDYSQSLSLISAAIVGVLLVHLTYFRHFWLALVRRAAELFTGE